MASIAAGRLIRREDGVSLSNPGLRAFRFNLQPNPARRGCGDTRVFTDDEETKWLTI
jgi:hypothetical protein